MKFEMNFFILFLFTIIAILPLIACSEEQKSISKPAAVSTKKGNENPKHSAPTITIGVGRSTRTNPENSQYPVTSGFVARKGPLEELSATTKLLRGLQPGANFHGLKIEAFDAKNLPPPGPGLDCHLGPGQSAGKSERSKSPGKNVSGTPGKNVPGTPEKNVSGTSGKNVPGTPGKNVPGTPGKNVPGTPGKNLPGTQGKNAPGTPGKNVSGTSGKNVPGTPGKNVPGTPGKNVPGTPGSKEK